MRNWLLVLVAVLGATAARAQDNPVFTIDSNGSEVVTMAVFNDVTEFQIRIEFVDPIAVGVYNNPDLVQVQYSVAGTLTNTTPSGFPAFALERTITGAEFYAQGSSLQFEVAATAFLDDGVQASELVGTGSDVVFRFDGREVNNGRFHPALLELRADGTGRIQNSNNLPDETDPPGVAFGEEYITDFTYIPAEFSVLTVTPVIPVDPNAPPSQGFGSGGGAIGFGALLVLIGLYRRRRFAD
ncbi:MAG: GlyGly-CTERM sorting domain-containing protein [Pseudomonadota bacterium]